MRTRGFVVLELNRFSHSLKVSNCLKLITWDIELSRSYKSNLLPPGFTSWKICAKIKQF